MKKILLLFWGICFAMPSFSQQQYSDYTSDYLSKTYNIKTGKPDKNGIFSVYIDIECSDSDDYHLNLIINSNKIDSFKASIEQAKAKYIEWRQVAIDNKVEKIGKNIDVGFPYVGAGFFYGEWRFDFSVKLSPQFLVIDAEYYLMIINTDKIVASDNQFMDTEGYIVFSTIDEINSFVEKLDMVKLQEFVNKKSSTESLFE